ncbi:endonuclease/exonuclease/phosphatase family protein [Mesonia ostreae]|uniref:Endonuclease/exonuclease/phosphatase family protein n=1 Tax=Mesonia ostreae TaxID=861110 RepID=A0ABU2KFD4_9FLAO|nr:endonuclease/exonuclease/phosphatase family protein [Mesonia ostreae]MDT0293416.1 endonuclease/exonuclease/phosphatase family protein [Mesonia ostreae]
MRKVIYSILFILGALLAILSLLSIFRNAEIRYLKMLDFPRIQFFIAAIICFLLLAVIIKKWKWQDYLLSLALFIGIGVQVFFLINYTVLVPVEVPTVKQIAENEEKLSILLTNVKMKNRTSQALLDLVAHKNPDIILAMEVDTWWKEQLKVLQNEYPYTQESINEVTYGLILYSKFPLEVKEIDYLTHDQVPSFESLITLPNAKKISFHSIHPVPPTHFEDLPDNAGEQENALLKLGNRIEDNKFPAIVAGDLNDVVWSYLDDLTGTKDLLYDLRVGRGFYNSYNAQNLWMRWPLDHIFVSEEFKLKTLQRQSSIGSDHFPIYAELVL